MAILNDVKAALRISAANTTFDAELTALILSAKADLGLSGVEIISDTDPLVQKAVITYCKAEFGYDNPDAERLQLSYERLKNSLTMSADHAYFAVTFVVKNALAVAIRQAVVTFGDNSLETDSTGTAIFYTREAKNVVYAVYADGYVADDDAANLLDVTASQTVNIVLAAA